MEELIPIPYQDDYLYDVASWQLENISGWLDIDYTGLYYQETNGHLIHKFINTHNITPSIGYKYHCLTICWLGGCHYIHLANIQQPMEIVEITDDCTMVFDELNRLRNLPGNTNEIAHRTMFFHDEDDKNKIAMFFKLNFGDWNLKEELI